MFTEVTPTSTSQQTIKIENHFSISNTMRLKRRWLSFSSQLTESDIFSTFLLEKADHTLIPFISCSSNTPDEECHSTLTTCQREKSKTGCSEAKFLSQVCHSAACRSETWDENDTRVRQVWVFRKLGPQPSG